MLDAIAAKYVECASERMPLRYVVMFFFSIIATTATVRVSDPGRVQAVVALSVSDLLSKDYWQSLDLTLGDLVLAGSAVAIGVFAERLLAEALFFLVNRVRGYRELILGRLKDLTRSPSDVESRAAMIKFIESAMQPVARKFSGSVCCSQAALSFFVILLLTNQSWRDIAIAIFLIIIGLLSTIRSLQIFISSYFPLLALRDALRGTHDSSYSAASGPS